MVHGVAEGHECTITRYGTQTFIFTAFQHESLCISGNLPHRVPRRKRSASERRLQHVSRQATLLGRGAARASTAPSPITTQTLFSRLLPACHVKHENTQTVSLGWGAMGGPHRSRLLSPITTLYTTLFLHNYRKFSTRCSVPRGMTKLLRCVPTRNGRAKQRQEVPRCRCPLQHASVKCTNWTGVRRVHQPRPRYKSAIMTLRCCYHAICRPFSARSSVPRDEYPSFYVVQLLTRNSSANYGNSNVEVSHWIRAQRRSILAPNRAIIIIIIIKSGLLSGKGYALMVDITYAQEKKGRNATGAMESYTPPHTRRQSESVYPPPF